MFEHLNYYELIEFVINSYINEFGERKFKTVLDKVMTSNKISGLISTSRYKGIPPGNKDFLYCINEIPYFIFSSGQTQVVASYIALQRWNEEVNSQIYLLNENDLKRIAIEMYRESAHTFH